MRLIFYLFLSFLGLQITAQSLFNEVIASAGMYHDGNIGKTAWTVGETVITTEYEDGYILTQGFHQPMTGYIPVKQTEKPNDIDKPIISVEDTQDGNFKINIKTSEYTKVVYTLSNVIGQIIIKDDVYTGPDGITISLKISNFSKGIYFFNVYKENNEKFDVKSIKILKYTN